jgi:hypothetical protein
MCNFNFEPLRNLIIYSAEFNGFFKPWLVFSFDQKTKKHKQTGDMTIKCPSQRLDGSAKVELENFKMCDLKMCD